MKWGTVNLISPWLHYLWLLPIGVVIGLAGTVIGAGGGFILLPLLLIFYPRESPEILTSISLAVVFFNAASGSAAYSRMRRIDYRSGLIFAAAAIPGAILGALTTYYIPRRWFDLILGLFMMAAAAYLFWHPERPEHAPADSSEKIPGPSRSGIYVRGALISVAVGYLSSLLGVGGGFIHVPALVRLLRFPVHIATATSHFILAIMALTGTIVHIATGAFAHGYHRTIILAAGVILGAQAGAWLSNHLQGRWIIRGLAAALVFVGIRVLVQAMRIS